jgi:hypothetical protein
LSEISITQPLLQKIFLKFSSPLIDLPGEGVVKRRRKKIMRRYLDTLEPRIPSERTITQTPLQKKYF